MWRIPAVPPATLPSSPPSAGGRRPAEHIGGPPLHRSRHGFKVADLLEVGGFHVAVVVGDQHRNLSSTM